MFVIEDWHNIGADYDCTLLAWHDNVARAWSGPLRSYAEEFRRQWRYYVLTCAGILRARYAQLWQIVLCLHAASPADIGGRHEADVVPRLLCYMPGP